MQKIKKVFGSIIESWIRNLSGGIGQRIRYQYYSRILKSCGSNVRIDIGVVFENPNNIELGSDVWIMCYSQILAAENGYRITNRQVRYYRNSEYSFGDEAVLKIGNEIQIGAYNIIHGYGGILIEDRVTLSARVSLYSQSHYYRDENSPGKVTYANSMVKSNDISCVVSPIVIKRGAWLGLGVSMFGGLVGENSFVTAHSVVLGEINNNSYAKGNPAEHIKSRFEG